MRAIRIVLMLCCLVSSLVFFSRQGGTDIITFKKGGKQRCVIVEEDDDAVHFVTRMGKCRMRRSRIEAIEYESEEVNADLREKWKRKKTETPEDQPEPAEKSPKKKGPQPLRTYTVEPTKLSISVAGHATGINSAQRVATFLIEDLGVVKGNRLFRVKVTSYRSGVRTVSLRDFYTVSSHGMRVNAKSLKGYPILRASLGLGKTASGHVAFPADSKLKWIFVKSDLAQFKLNLETGEFASMRGPF